MAVHISARLEAPVLTLMNLPEDVFPTIVEQLCGGEDVHDITLWRHACRLAQTCSTFARWVLYSDHCETGVFNSEYVGPDVADGRDPFKESFMTVSRGIWHYTPLVDVEFKYGAVAHDQYVYSLTFVVPLLLEDVMRVFYKPPGWKAAGALALSGKDAPIWSECFPPDKYPEAPERIRVRDAIKFTLSRERLEPVVDARGQRWFDESTVDLSDQLPSGVHVTATCSTGIEEFRRGARAHYLDDLEVGLCGVFSGPLMETAVMQRFMGKLGVDPEEPPDLYYRWEPGEARRLAGYPHHNRKALHDLLYPPRRAPKRVLRKLRDLQDSDVEEEWDPDARRRQKHEARERSKAALAELRLPDSFDTTGDEHLMPAHASPLAAQYAESESDDSFVVGDDMLQWESDAESDASECSAPPDHDACMGEAWLPPPYKLVNAAAGPSNVATRVDSDEEGWDDAPPTAVAASSSGMATRVDSDEEGWDDAPAAPLFSTWAMHHGASLPDRPVKAKRRKRTVG